MRGIADQEQARAMPAWEPARLDIEHRQLLPGLELVDSVVELGRDGRDSLAELRQAGSSYLSEAALLVGNVLEGDSGVLLAPRQRTIRHV